MPSLEIKLKVFCFIFISHLLDLYELFLFFWNKAVDKLSSSSRKGMSNVGSRVEFS